MKKVAMILPALKNVGPVRVAHDIVVELSHTYGCTDIYFEVFYFDSIGSVSFPCKQTKLTPFNFYKLYNFDIIHSHMIRPDFLNAILVLFKGRKISTIHNIVETDLYYSHGKVISWIFSRIWKLIWRCLDKQIVLTEVAKKYYVEKMSISNKNISVINNGVDAIVKPDVYDEDILNVVQSYKDKNLIVMGSVALFNERKGLEQIIKVLSIDKTLAYVVIGDGPSLDKLKLLAEKLGVSDRVYFSGFKDDGKKNVFLFDCYVMPSREEGFPLALTEAISTGVVTVCSDIPVFKEILDIQSTVFFELDNLNSLQSAIYQAIQQRDVLSSVAKIKYEDKYTRKIMAENYMKEYMSL